MLLPAYSRKMQYGFFRILKIVLRYHFTCLLPTALSGNSKSYQVRNWKLEQFYTHPLCILWQAPSCLWIQYLPLRWSSGSFMILRSTFGKLWEISWEKETPPCDSGLVAAKGVLLSWIQFLRPDGISRLLVPGALSNELKFQIWSSILWPLKLTYKKIATCVWCFIWFFIEYTNQACQEYIGICNATPDSFLP